MRKVNIINKTTLILKGIKCFLEREVKPFGTSARIDFPKEFIGKKVFVIIADEWKNIMCKFRISYEIYRR